VLEYLQTQTEAVGVGTMAQDFAQHPNTVRLHLDALVSAGLVLRERSPGPGRGRPAWKYRADPDHPEPDSRVQEFGALAAALAAYIAATSSEPARAGRDAGLLWGQALAPGPRESPAARRTVTEMLAELDFSPEPNPDHTDLTLTTCPLLDVATRYPDVVCAVHEGLIVGALRQMGAATDGVALHPFARPNGCALTMPGDAL
jgi:predicted ArsR family transcriptional regulator